MKCVVTEYSGFCHGVEHTISTIETLLTDKKKPVSCVGLPVHNPQVTEKLISHGLKVVETIDEIDAGILVIRAHGLSPQQITHAKKRGLIIVDTTCGSVVKAQNIAQSLYVDGYTVIIIGEPEHPEVKSIFGYTDERGIVCSSLEEIDSLPLDGKIGIVSQTTFAESIFKQIAGALVKRNFVELRIFDTLCYSLEKRNSAAQHIAAQVDMILVIGGKMSSNTKRLYEACRLVNQKSYHIETKRDIIADWFHNVKSVGITAGASTPQWIINEVHELVKMQ